MPRRQIGVVVECFDKITAGDGDLAGLAIETEGPPLLLRL